VNTSAFTLDSTNTPGVCQGTDADPWEALPVTPTKVAYVTTIGAAGRADLVWGVRTANNQAPGSYSSTLTVEALAPNV
jgi:hypothetical protein